MLADERNRLTISDQLIVVTDAITVDTEILGGTTTGKITSN